MQIKYLGRDSYPEYVKNSSCNSILSHYITDSIAFSSAAPSGIFLGQMFAHMWGRRTTWGNSRSLSSFAQVSLHPCTPGQREWWWLWYHSRLLSHFSPPRAPCRRTRWPVQLSPRTRALPYLLPHDIPALWDLSLRTPLPTTHLEGLPSHAHLNSNSLCSFPEELMAHTHLHMSVWIFHIPLSQQLHGIIFMS